MNRNNQQRGQIMPENKISSLPKFYETFIPILDYLKDGRTMHRRDLQNGVKDKYYANLDANQLSLTTKDGELIIINRISWGTVYLKRAGMIFQPSRAMMQITEKGLRALGQGSLSLNDIKNNPDYIAHEPGRKRIVSDDLLVATDESTPQDLIDSGVQSIEEQTKADLLDRLKKVDPYYFEHVVLDLFNKMGYGEFQETSKSGDGGIDGIINQDELGLEKIYVQAKRYSETKIHETDIRNFIGAMSDDTTKGIFVTTSSFDASAIQKARDARHTIITINGPQLVDLMYKFGIGVQIKNSYIIKDIDEDYFI